MGVPRFRSLRHRDFRLYFLGQLVSLHGSWMHNVAQAWLVYRLTQSSFMLGLVGFAGLLPVLLFGLFGGVLADRQPRRRLFMAAQSLACMQALLLGMLTLAGWVQVWHVLVLALLLGVVHAVEIPARHALIPELVPREDIPNAVALNSSLFNLARFAGPAVAGWLIGLFGEGPVFLLNAASFLALLVAAAVMRVGDAAAEASSASALAHLAEGLRYAWRRRPIRAALALMGAVTLLGGGYAVLMPVFASEVFGSGPGTLGLLLGTAGAGALVGALVLAGRQSGRGLEKLVGLAAAGVGAGLFLFSLTPTAGFALLVLPLVGFSMTTLAATTNTYVQLQVPDALRGRVMALFSVTFIGMMPLGNLLAGALGQVLGAPTAVAVLSVLCVGVAVTFLFSGPGARPR